MSAAAVMAGGSATNTQPLTYEQAQPLTYTMAPTALPQVQYMTSQPATTYMAPQPITYAMAPQQELQYVNDYGQPCTSDGQLLVSQQPMTYTMAPQQGVQYVNEHGQPCTSDGQLLVSPQPMTYTTAPQQELQYVNEHGQPCTADAQLLEELQYVNEHGQPCTQDGSPLSSMQMQYQYTPSPQVFNITPQQFAILAQGGSLTETDLGSILGGSAASDAPLTAAAPFADVPFAAEPALAAVTEPKKKTVSTKKLTSKKSSKGCC